MAVGLMIKCRACGRIESNKYIQAGKWDYANCENCGLTFLLKEPTKKELQKIYSYKNGNDVKKLNLALFIFLEIKFFSDLLNFQGEQINKSRADSVPIKKPGKLLDIGAGPGTFMTFMDKRGWSVYATEMGDKLVGKLQIQFGKKNIYKGEVQKVKFGKLKFDVISLWHVFEHMQDISKVLKSVRKLMTKKSVLIIEVPHARSLSLQLFKDKWTLLLPPQHLHLWTQKSFKEILEKHDLRITKVEYPPHFPFVLASSLIRYNKYFIILSPILLPISVLWGFVISSIGRGDVIRIYAKV